MAKSAKQIIDALNRPTITPEALWKSGAIPIGRNGIYEACKSGEIENFKIGEKIIIPTAPLRRKLGIEAT